MPDNPYQPSTTLASDQAPRLRRPTGILLVMFLYLIVGASRLGLFFYLFNMTRKFDPILAFRLPIAICILTAVLGMFLGKRWGWMIATTLAVLGTLDQVLAVLGVRASPSEGQLQQIAELLTLAFVTASLVVYLFREHVLAYFHVPLAKRGTILAGQIMVGIVVLLSWRAIIFRQFSNLE